MTADLDRRWGEFEQHRGRLRAIAYRMLGSVVDAEDAVQDAYLRWQRSDTAVESTGAWLTTIVTRLCLDRLQSARSRREVYVGPWLPEPIVTDEHEIDAQTVSVAFLLLLERLSPIERAAYLLHAVFESDHRQIGEILGKSEDAVRQAFHRAKAHLAAGKPRFAPTKERHAELLVAFADACLRADASALAGLLAADAEAHTDGGGTAKAARKVVRGADRVARLFLGLAKKGSGDGLRPELAEVNGWPCLVLYDGDEVRSVVGIETDGATIHAVHATSERDKVAVLAGQLATRR